MEISIKENIKTLVPDVRLGLLQGKVEAASSAVLDEEYKGLTNNPEILDTRSAVIIDTRNAYKLLGKQPSRYRPSSEALRRRLKSDKNLYRINNLIDTVNLISIKTGYCIGAFDKDKIRGEIYLDIGDTSEYLAIGRGPLNINRLPCLWDQLGPFGNPSSDSERTKLTDQTSQILLVIYDFMSNIAYEKSLKIAQQMLKKYCKFQAEDQ